MAPCGDGYESFESALVDLDVTRCRGEDSSVVDQEGLGSVGAHRNLAGDGNDRSVEHAVGDFDAAGVLGIEAVAAAKIKQAGFEPSFLLGKRTSSRRKLQIVQAKLVDRRSALIDEVGDRFRRGDGAERNRFESAFIQIPAIFCFSRTRIGWTGPRSTTAMSAGCSGARPPG
jgi:hypothetical protein